MNLCRSTACLLAAVLIQLAVHAQSKDSVVRLDPAFDAVVPAGGMVETLKEGFGFINGIVWVREGNSGRLLISDIPANVINQRV